MFTISNQILEVVITSQGAELESIKHKENGIDYLWNGDPAFWPKKSPALFPIVGGLKDTQYQFANKSYSLGRHGFARENVYEVTAQSTNSIRFSLKENANTLAAYPFAFVFSIEYTVTENKLFVKYIVENTGAEDLYFSVGAHPAFNVPLVKGTSYDDYYLKFEQKETVGKYPLSAEGLVELAPIPFLENRDTLALTKSLFYGDALVFKELKSNSIGILSNKTPHGLTVHYTNFPYMGIWSFKDADFVCIEPWCGIADAVNTTGELTEKEGIEKLGPQQVFTREWWVELF